MKVMISQPMNGVPDSEVRKIQDDLKEKFAKYNIDVIDSFLTEVPDTEIRNPRLFYLGRTIQNFLSDADAVYFCTGWERAKGCRIERHICEEYGIPILDKSFFKINDRKYYTIISNEKDPDWEEWEKNLPTTIFLAKNINPDLCHKNKNNSTRYINISEEKWEEIRNGATIKENEKDMPYSDKYCPDCLKNMISKKRRK